MTLSDAEIIDKLKSFTGWQQQNGALQKTYRFTGFMKAVEFVNKVAVISEHEMQFPDIIIESNQVTVRVVPDEDGITDKQFSLIKLIEPVALDFL